MTEASWASVSPPVLAGGGGGGAGGMLLLDCDCGPATLPHGGFGYDAGDDGTGEKVGQFVEQKRMTRYYD